MRRLSVFASLVLYAYGCGSDEGQKTTPDPLSGGDAGKSSGGPGDPIGDDDDDDDDDGPGGGAPIPYDATVMKSVHNSYERSEPIFDQLLYHRVRSLEFDIHNEKGGAAPNGNWFVFHENIPGFNSTSCTLLSDCLGAVAAFHAAVPKHEVITLWIDLKDDFQANRQPADLDALVEKTLGRENIVAPKDLIEKCDGATTVRAAVGAPCAFPTLGALRGKIMLTVTGGSKCDANSKVSKYGGAKPSERLVFLAPDLNASCPPAEYEKHSDVVFFNMSFDDRAHAKTMRDEGLVGRLYKGGLGGGLDNAGDFAAGRETGAVHLATDKANFEQDTWSKTHGNKGFPFLCDGCVDREEAGDVLGVTATSGDQGSTKDSAFFALAESTKDEAWSAAISVPSSHTEANAKACLVARASDAPGAVSVAFCRPFDSSPPRILLRKTTDGATTENTAAPLFGLSSETSHFMRLELKTAGPDTQIDAQVSRDGKEWVSAQKSVIPGALPLRGVSVSSRGSTKRRALFAALTRADGDGSEVMNASKLDTKKPIGDGASGAAFDGIFGP
ncbi:MAG: hypothetical protein KIT84_27355 [Labilithrix sp.]|nr:hypothetical protein [Labilithrix sp.]MCW5814775.1 hypothetical protein [Labilithrix sp.]